MWLYFIGIYLYTCDWSWNPNLMTPWIYMPLAGEWSWLSARPVPESGLELLGGSQCGLRSVLHSGQQNTSNSLSLARGNSQSDVSRSLHEIWQIGFIWCLDGLQVVQMLWKIHGFAKRVCCRPKRVYSRPKRVFSDRRFRAFSLGHNVGLISEQPKYTRTKPFL